MKKKQENIIKIIKSIGRRFYGSEEITNEAPQNKGSLEFFKLDKYVSIDELEKEYQNRGLIPASILSICEYDKTHNDEMDKMSYVATQWKDKNGEWCFASFNRWHGERGVYVDRNGSGWSDSWWFAGLRKLGPESSELKPLSLEKRLDAIEARLDKLKTI